MYKESEKAIFQSNDNSDICQNAYFAYINEISQYKLLTDEEEISLFQRILSGDDVAKELFINSNLRLVVRVAKKYYVPGYNDLLDLIQEGNIGLIKAVEQFDLSKGCKFSTFAVYAINKAIQSASSRSGLPLELPQNKLALINKIRRTIELFEEKNNKKPSFTELSTLLNVRVESITALMPFITPPVSLNSKVFQDESDKELIDVFEEYYHEDPSDPEKTFIIKETKEAFRDIINKVLTEKEKYILYSRWGLFDNPTKSVITLSKELHMSKQGVQQSESRSIGKLTKHLLSLNKSFLDFV